MKPFISVLILLSALFCSCTQGAAPAPEVPTDSIPNDTVVHADIDTVVHADYDVSSLPVYNRFYLTQTQSLKADSLKEISGMASSSTATYGSFWVEEDSGNKNAVYLLDTLAKLKRVKYLAGALNLDWEDLAGGPGPEQGKYYLYMGDIGDNLKIRPFITIYRFEEPGFSSAQDTLVTDFDVINLVYPDGPHNAEALMVDPVTKDIFILTKDSLAGLYVARYPQNATEITKLELLETLPISTVTAADITRDGNQVLVKNYNDIFYWKRNAGESLEDCLLRTPLRLNYKKELQGESIAWSPNGKGFFTLGEQVGNHIPILYHYEFF